MKMPPADDRGVPLEIQQVLRLKGTIDAALAAAAKDLTAGPSLVETYNRTRGIVRSMVVGFEAELEFELLFAPVQPMPDGLLNQPLVAAAETERARGLLAQLSGWLGSWPSAEVLLDELIVALEVAEAQAEPEEKTRLRGLIDGLRGAGRDIAVDVIAAYLGRVHT